MSYFDEAYYVQAKLKQLDAAGATDANGQPFNVFTLRAAVASAGLTLEEHYNTYGRGEKLNPNAYFNESEYLQAKLNQLNDAGDVDASGKPYTVETLLAVIEKAGMTPAEHYETYGAFETNSKGELLNPSNAFDANAYVQAKLVEMQTAGNSIGDKPAEALTPADVLAALKSANLSPVAHYIDYGAKEAGEHNVPMVQTVPVAQRVANDPVRETLGENVPGNYNPPTTGALNEAAAAKPVVKPADMGGLAPETVSPPVVAPSKPLPTPVDKEYVAPPKDLVDTNEKPVIPPSTSDSGKATDDFIVVNPDGSGTVIKPDGTPGGNLPSGSLTPGEGGEIVVPPDVKPTPPSTGGGSTGGDGGGSSSPTFSATVDAANKLTLGGTADGDVTYATSADGSTVTFTCNSLTASITKAAFDALVAVDIAAGQTLQVNTAVDFGNTLTLTGGGNVVMNKAVAVGAITVDAQNLSGNLTYMGATGQVDTVTGGAGNDIVQITTTDATPANADVINLGAGNNGLIVDLSVSGAFTGTYNGGTGTADILKVNVPGATVDGTNYKVDAETASGGNTTGGVEIGFKAAAFTGLLGKATGFEVLRLNATGTTPHDNSHSNAIFRIDAADLGSFKQVEFNENARIYNLAADTIVRDTLGNGSITLTLGQATANTTGIKVDTVAKDDPSFTTTISAVSAADNGSGKLADYTSAFTKLTLTGDGNVVLDNSTQNTSVTVNASAMTAEGSLKFTGGSGSNVDTITGSAGSDTIRGGNGADVIAGGAGGADFLRGESFGAASGDGDTLYAGSVTVSYAQSVKAAVSGYNTDVLTTFNGSTAIGVDGVATAGWLSADALAILKDATILEGRQGADHLVASNQKDVFLYQTGGPKDGSSQELSVADLGTDTIHNFHVGQDKILVFDQGAKLNGVAGDESYSAGWGMTEDTNAKVITGTFTGGLPDSYTGTETITLTWTTDYTAAKIVISDGVFGKSDGTNLEITLTGILGASETTTIADFFNGTFA